jgi:hypothetical protein
LLQHYLISRSPLSLALLNRPQLRGPFTKHQYPEAVSAG